MEKIKIMIKKSSETGIFHDSRKDVKTLGIVTNNLIDKLNEAIDEINRLNKRIDDLTNER